MASRPLHSSGGERIDHLLAEALLVIEDVMRDAEPRRDEPRIVDVLAGAAGALMVDGLANGHRAATSPR